MRDPQSLFVQKNVQYKSLHTAKVKIFRFRNELEKFVSKEQKYFEVNIV